MNIVRDRDPASSMTAFRWRYGLFRRDLAKSARKANRERNQRSDHCRARERWIECSSIKSDCSATLYFRTTWIFRRDL